MEGGLAAEDRAPIGLERLEEDVLDGEGVFVADVELAAPLGLADVDPVGGSIAGAAEALRLAEGFQQHGTDAIALAPVVGKLAGGESEQVGGEIGHLDPGQDQIPGVIDEAGQVALAGGGVPADEAVAGGGFPGGGAEAEQGQGQAVGRAGKVAQLGAGQGLVAEVVVALDELVPERATRVVRAERFELQGPQGVERAGGDEQGRRVAGGRGNGRPGPAERAPGRGQVLVLCLFRPKTAIFSRISLTPKRLEIKIIRERLLPKDPVKPLDTGYFR